MEELHRAHLRSLYQGVRNGTITGIGTGAGQITQQEVLHAMADLILAVAMFDRAVAKDPTEPSPSPDVLFPPPGS